MNTVDSSGFLHCPKCPKGEFPDCECDCHQPVQRPMNKETEFRMTKMRERIRELEDEVERLEGELGVLRGIAKDVVDVWQGADGDITLSMLHLREAI